MEKIIVSACLLGFAVRYDGSDKAIAGRIWERWRAEGRLVPLCPEVAGGLPVPRPPAEIVGGDGGAVLDGDGRVIDVHGAEVTGEFVAGARAALATVRREGIGIAVLTERSPSCGSRSIYDGTFSGRLVDGEGLVAALLRRNGVEVFGHGEIEAADERVRKREEASRLV